MEEAPGAGVKVAEVRAERDVVEEGGENVLIEIAHGIHDMAGGYRMELLERMAMDRAEDAGDVRGVPERGGVVDEEEHLVQLRGLNDREGRTVLPPSPLGEVMPDDPAGDERPTVLRAQEMVQGPGMEIDGEQHFRRDEGGAIRTSKALGLEHATRTIVVVELAKLGEGLRVSDGVPGTHVSQAVDQEFPIRRTEEVLARPGAWRWRGRLVAGPPLGRPPTRPIAGPGARETGARRPAVAGTRPGIPGVGGPLGRTTVGMAGAPSESTRDGIPGRAGGWRRSSRELGLEGGDGGGQTAKLFAKQAVRLALLLERRVLLLDQGEQAVLDVRRGARPGCR